MTESKLPRQLLGSAFWEFRPTSATLVRSLPVRRRTCSPISGFPGGTTTLGEDTEHLRAGGKIDTPDSESGAAVRSPVILKNIRQAKEMDNAAIRYTYIWYISM